MTYKQALDYIKGLECLGIRFSLSNIKKVLGLLDNPEKNLRYIHIAGTNGKGSVAAMIYSILKEAGFKTGLYTSPHLIDLSERVQINGKKISRIDITGLTETIRDATKYLSLELTYFEFVTVAAFLYFTNKKVDVVVLETGMGGRLDATNVVKEPLVSVITNIDYEHTDYLGNSLKSIAREKAGIIKKNGMVITGIKNDETLKVISNVCSQKGAKLFYLGKDIKVRISSSNERFQKFDYWGIFNNYKGLKINLRGKHQVENAALSIGVVETLSLKNIFIKEMCIRKGLIRSLWPGRLDLFKLNAGGKKIRIILDGAHNPSGIESLKDFLRVKTVPYENLILILGSLADKNVKLMTSKIVPMTDEVIVVSPQVERALDRSVLREETLKHIDRKNVHTARTVGAGIKKAFKMCHNKSLICVAGSLYVIGEAMKELRNQ